MSEKKTQNNNLTPKKSFSSNSKTSKDLEENLKIAGITVSQRSKSYVEDAKSDRNNTSYDLGSPRAQNNLT